MEDEKIKNMLKKYMEKEMDLIIPEEMEGFGHTFSERFDRKMRQVMMGEKFLGRNIRFMRPMRYAAIFALVLTGIFVAGTVSARVFNFQPWKYITSYKSDDRMEEKVYTYKEGEGQTESSAQEQAEVKKEIPSYVPEGMEQGELQKTDSFIDVEWEGRKGEHISYVRAVISEGMKTSTDAEYKSKKVIVIAEYKGFLYKKDNEMWIDWDDTKYNHYIASMGIEDENELIKMSESLYESDETKK